MVTTDIWGENYRNGNSAVLQFCVDVTKESNPPIAERAML
jgi:hypothetical protein